LHGDTIYLHSFPTRRSSDLFSKVLGQDGSGTYLHGDGHGSALFNMLTSNRAEAVVNYGSLVKSLFGGKPPTDPTAVQNTIYENRSEEHTSELQSRENLVCRL